MNMDRINEILSLYKYPALIALVGVVMVFFGTTQSPLTQTSDAVKELPKESLVEVEDLQVKVDIGGAVTKPGVYSLEKDSRVEDLIRKAGGLDASASAEYVTKRLNLSQKVSDGMKVYIPFKGEEKSPSVAGVMTSTIGTVEASGEVAQKIIINNASQKELEELPGVGPATATKIITNRPYADPNELVSKKSVGNALYEKIKDLIEL